MSTAYNPELSVPAISAELFRRLTNGSQVDDSAADYLQSAVEFLTGETVSKQSFEKLLGPLNRIPDVLEALAGFSQLDTLTSLPIAINTALKDACDFIRAVHRLGVGHALQIVDERARDVPNQHQHIGIKLVKDLIAKTGNSYACLTFGTLNYDNLLIGAVLEVAGTNNVADFASGYNESPPIKLVNGMQSVIGRPLREFNDLPFGRIAVYQLHGSATWWRRDEGGPIFKFEVADLRDLKVFDVWRNGSLRWSPVVVMTDLKTQVVGRYPFGLSYAGFEERLKDADAWVIVGYGFEDEPVNAMLKRVGSKSKCIFVIDYKPKVQDADAFKKLACDVLSSGVISWTFEGIPAVFNQPEWNNFAT